jgi:AP-3 complex subunit delta-1
MSSYSLLAEDVSVKLVYETRVTFSQSNRLVVSVIFTNLTQCHIKDLDFNVLDSLNTKFIRGPGVSSHDAVRVPFTLPPGTQNEGQFAFHVGSLAMPQRLKGTLTYIIKTDDASTCDKLDLKLSIPCCAFLVAVPCNSDTYAKLLTDGSLTSKYATQCNASNADFSVTVAKICFHAHFTVVELVDKSVSLYSKSIQGHHVCLLVKQLANGGLSIDGKSSDSSLLSSVVDEVKAIVTRD